MTDHDDRLEGRIRDLVGLAQSDAPDPMEAERPRRAATRSVAARVAVVAAAVVLVVAGVAVLSRRNGTDPAAVTVDSPAATSSSLAASSTTAFDPAACGRNLGYPYEETGTVHTVVPSQLPLDVTIAAATQAVCTGGTTTVSITLTNPTDGVVDLQPTPVVLSAGIEKWVVGQILLQTLQPGASRTLDVTVSVGPIPPGSYFIALYGFGASAPIEVSGPRVCVVTDLVSNVVTNEIDGTASFQLTRVTNRSDVPCVVLRPTFVEGVRFGETSSVLTLQTGTGAFGSMGAPLQDHVLDPGESADLGLTMSQACDGERKVYDMIDVHLGVGNDPDDTRTVSIGRDVDVTCGLWLSQWLEP